MEAIRTTQRVKNQQISVHVPDMYENAEVEVIVLLMDSKNQKSGNKKEAFLQFLRNGPTLGDEELQQIEMVQQELKAWTVQEF